MIPVRILIKIIENKRGVSILEINNINKNKNNKLIINVFNDELTKNYVKIQNIQSKKMATAILHIPNAFDPDKPIDAFILDSEADTSTQEFIVYPLDENEYSIVSLFTGEMMCLFEVDGFPAGVIVNSLDPADPANNSRNNSHKWLINSMNNTQIRDTHYNTCLMTMTENPLFPSQTFEFVAAEKRNDNNENEYWNFKSIQPLFIPVPSAQPQNPNTGNGIGSIPIYETPDDNLPLETEKIFTGWTKIPASFIKDNSVPSFIRINISPYYVLERYDYWKRLESASLAPGERLDTINSYGTTVTNQQTMDRDTQMTMDESLSLKFNLTKKIEVGTTGDLKKQITTDLNLHESTTTNIMQSCVETLENRNPNDNNENNKGKSYVYTRYIQATDLILKRPSQNDHDPDVIINTWTFTNKKTVIDTHISY